MSDRKIQNSKSFRHLQHLTIAQSSRQPNDTRQNDMMRYRSLKFAASALAIALGLAEWGAIAPAAGQSIAQTAIARNQKTEGDRLLKQGNDQLNANQMDAALESLEQALAIYREVKDRGGEGQTLKSIGNAYYSLKSYDKTIEYQQQALAIARELKDLDLEARALSNIGVAYRDSGKPAKGIELLQQALAVAQKSQNEVLEAIVLQDLIQTYNSAQINQPAKTLELTPRLMQVSQRIKVPTYEMEALRQSSIAYAALGKDQQRIMVSKQVIEVVDKLPENPTYQNYKWWGLMEIGHAYSALKDYSKAILAYREALDFAKKKVSNELAQVAGLTLICSNYAYLEDYQKASEAAQEMILIAKRQSKKVDQLNILKWSINCQTLVSGVAAWKKQDYAQSIEHYKRLLKLLEEASELAKGLPRDLKTEEQFKMAIVDAYLSLNTSYMVLGEMAEASNYAQKAINLVEQTQDLELELSVLMSLNQFYFLVGDWSRTIDSLKKAVEISRKIKDPFSETRALFILASSYGGMGQFSNALNTANQALNLSDTLDPKKYSSYSLLGPALRSLRNESTQSTLVPATLKADQEATLRETILFIKPEILSLLATLYQQTGEFDKSLDYSQRSLTLWQELSPSTQKYSLPNVLLKIGEIYSQKGEFQKAIDSVAQARETARKLKNFSQEVTSLIALSWIYQLQGKDAEALKVGQQALTTAQQSMNATSEVEALDGLVALYEKQQDLGNVLKLKQQAMNAAQKAKAPVLFLLGRSNSIANTYITLGEYQAAHQLLNQIRVQSQHLKLPSFEADTWLLDARLAFTENNPQAMLKAAQQSAKLAKQVDMPSLKGFTAYTLSFAYGASGDDVKAIEAAQSSLAIAEQLKDIDLEKSTLILLGNLHRKFGRPQEAMKNLQAALTLQNPGLKGGGNQDIYIELARIYAA